MTENTIASIPEASGISFCKDTKTLIVANDEGFFYELSDKGVTLLKHKLGNYDLEGVVCDNQKLFFSTEEGMILEIDRKTLKKKKLALRGQGFSLNKKHGIEGITKINNLYYLSIQAKKKKNAKLLIVKVGTNYAKVIKVIKHGIIDASGLEFYNKKLYIVSDKKNKLYVYDIKRKKIVKKVRLEKFAQEGITFDNNGFVYFADDNGAVLKYPITSFSL